MVFRPRGILQFLNKDMPFCLSLRWAFSNLEKLHKAIHPRRFSPVSNFWQLDSSVFLCNFPYFSSSALFLFFSSLRYLPLFICAPSIKVPPNNTPLLIHLWFINKIRVGFHQIMPRTYTSPTQVLPHLILSFDWYLGHLILGIGGRVEDLGWSNAHILVK